MLKNPSAASFRGGQTVSRKEHFAGIFTFLTTAGLHPAILSLQSIAIFFYAVYNEIIA